MTCVSICWEFAGEEGKKRGGKAQGGASAWGQEGWDLKPLRIVITALAWQKLTIASKKVEEAKSVGDFEDPSMPTS